MTQEHAAITMSIAAAESRTLSRYKKQQQNPGPSQGIRSSSAKQAATGLQGSHPSGMHVEWMYAVVAIETSISW